MKLRSPFTLFLLLGMTGLLSARAQVIQVSGDATVSSAYPNTNFGGAANLAVSPTSTALFEFPLSQLPSGTTASQITSATLTVYVNRVNKAGAMRVSTDLTGATFNESQVTYNNDAVGANSSSAPASSLISTQNVFFSSDATSAVKQLVSSGYTTASFFLAPGGGSQLDLRLDSKENDATAHPAVLTITLANQGPPGVNGTNGTNGTNGAPGAPGMNGTNGTNGTNGSQTWTANLTFPSTAGTTGNTFYFGSPIGANVGVLATSQPAYSEMLAPNSCTETGLLARLPSGNATSTLTVQLQGSSGTLASCSIAAGASSCTQATGATAAVAAADTLYLVVVGVPTSLAGQHLLTSFLCQ